MSSQMFRIIITIFAYITSITFWYTMSLCMIEEARFRSKYLVTNTTIHIQIFDSFILIKSAVPGRQGCTLRYMPIYC